MKTKPPFVFRANERAECFFLKQEEDGARDIPRERLRCVPPQATVADAMKGNKS